MDCFVEFQYLLLSKNWQKKKNFFSQIKNQMSLYGYLSIKQQHMYRLRALLNASHIMSNSNERENEKRRRRSFVLS